MKPVVVLMLSVLMLSAGMVNAAERKSVQESAAPAVARNTTPKLDLNRVSREDLLGVPGIGPRMAQSIVDLRGKKGSFKRMDELLEVTGIKEKKLAAITGYLEIVPPLATSPAPPSAQSR